MIFDKFPFTNYEKINLDWLLKKMQECVDAVSNFVVDTVLDITSNHAIANKAVSEALNSKLTVNNDRVSYTNLDSNLQNAYNNANTALQAVPDTYRTATAQDAIDNTKQDKLFPNGLNVEDVNRFVCVGGIDGDGSYYTKDIGAIYKGITKYRFSMAGRDSVELENLKAYEVYIYIYSDANTVTEDKTVTVRLYAEQEEAAAEEQAFKLTASGLIKTTETSVMYNIKLNSHDIFITRKPVGSLSWSTLSGATSGQNAASTNKYITRLSITSTVNFSGNSFIDLEVREYV